MCDMIKQKNKRLPVPVYLEGSTTTLDYYVNNESCLTNNIKY
jgi:hypothetical protein